VGLVHSHLLKAATIRDTLHLTPLLDRLARKRVSQWLTDIELTKYLDTELPHLGL